MPPTNTAQIGDRVSFRVSDVFLPEPAEVLANLTADVEANGVVVEFSDSGSSPRAYAVVRITERQSVLLPVGSLRILANAKGGLIGAAPKSPEQAPA
jgi:hypothetical protein